MCNSNAIPAALQERLDRIEKLIRERSIQPVQQQMVFEHPPIVMLKLHDAWRMHCPIVTYPVFKQFVYKLKNVKYNRYNSTIELESVKQVREYILKTSRRISQHYFVNNIIHQTFLIRGYTHEA